MKFESDENHRTHHGSETMKIQLHHKNILDVASDTLVTEGTSVGWMV